MELYVATTGNDQWSGKLPDPNAEGTDGPLASVAGARDRIRRLSKYASPEAERAAYSGPITVSIRGGRYTVTEPIEFGPEDSLPVTYTAYPGETPILDGGTRIAGWKTETINGKACWVADLPEVASGRWSFRELFVNGERRKRPRLPKEGLFVMEDVPGLSLPAGWHARQQNAFIAEEGNFGNWDNLGDVEVVALHWWIEERLPVESYNPETRLVKLSRSSYSPLADDRQKHYARYYIENVSEALTEPGEWYLDRSEGKLHYFPFPGETPDNTEVFAPRLLQLLRIQGDPDSNNLVEFVQFRGITFQHTDWRQPGEDDTDESMGCGAPAERHNRGNCGAAAQAACDVPGVIRLESARHCSFESCTIRNVGWYGIEIADGCEGIRVDGCSLHDLGAGGVKINGSDAAGPRCRRTGNNQITDNNIQSGGRVFHSAVGVLSAHSYGNLIAHNHIHDLFYTGISCGWVWGYGDNVSCNNRIEKNHIHNIGQGMLSDMGGVYLLGVQPGTIVRGNLIHDVNKLNYGGWCLYTDEGSSHIILENNVCHSSNGEIFHQHYGRENVVRNNILVFGEEALIAYSRVEPHLGLTFERNILVSDSAPMFLRDYSEGQRRIRSDLNLFWDSSGEAALDDNGEKKLSLDEWQALGQDQHSLIADPKFEDLAKWDFTLAEDSPAFALGFRAIDVSDIGPRRSDG
ncbi:MAG: hypothetical protein AUJ92_11710 [Armatimonadetes bacterium CG2_30_59_28]|nr:right-handed parallel beta-helix repeat-containing protein [Armatimonadota bacterium]OIO93764.1 MAG: hypothetical protein AUJ92_11710 [Armatimonadetes bacterium CG2_30_59_28]PIU67487.1 MAG: hypothetical protein COS85_00620 [Armatimonadetes bacterium CG07_land_8_20_14_0_80_59_28]PIX39564.1 MAG: hypothetical protein COZ56_17105 [Armatimonadetes bacterium CG_4_8_14_3_um_filter_58_9]